MYLNIVLLYKFILLIYLLKGFRREIEGFVLRTSKIRRYLETEPR